MILIIFLVSLIAVVLTYHIKLRKRVHPPKGLKEMKIERGLPIVGIIFQIKRSLTFHLKELGIKHGPLFSIRLGMRDIVVLNNYDMIIKALKENLDVFTGRFEPDFRKHMSNYKGFAFVDGEIWNKHRGFLMAVFRDFGIGGSESEEVTQIECRYLLEDLAKLDGKCVKAYEFFSLYNVNVVCQFVIGMRFSRENKEMEFLHELMKKTIQTQEKFELLSLMYPFLNTSSWFIKLSTCLTSIRRPFQKAKEYFRHKIDEHSERLRPDSEGEDFIDKYIIKQRQMKKKYGSDEGFTEDQLAIMVYELIAAGYESLSNFMQWSCLFMSKFPDIQKNVYLEIVDKIGSDRMIAFSDRTHLNYTQSVIDEMLRMSSFLPFGVPRRALMDTSVDGYFIRKNSIVFPNLYNCHHDPDVWDDPMQFNPKRFLTIDAEGVLRYTPRKNLIPFSVGKRNCPAKNLGKMEYFVFLTNVLQNFEITSFEEISDKQFQDCLHVGGNIIRACLVKDFVFKRRLCQKNNN